MKITIEFEIEVEGKCADVETAFLEGLSLPGVIPCGDCDIYINGVRVVEEGDK